MWPYDEKAEENTLRIVKDFEEVWVHFCPPKPCFPLSTDTKESRFIYMAQNVIPKRSEVPEEFTWNLKDMFESDEAWFAEYEALKEMPARIAAFQGKLGESAETLLESFRLDDEISTRLSRLYGYASCKGDKATADNQ